MSEEILNVLISTAKEAGNHALKLQQSGRFNVTNKGGTVGTHFLTEADVASQEIILKRLQEAFPNVPVVSEEKENQPDIPSHCFLVDPIDGTPCFIHGCDEWGVMVTHLTDHVPDAAVVYVPGRGLLAQAQRGRGCYLNDTKVNLGSWPVTMRDKTMIGLELGPWWTKDALPATVLLPLLERFSVRSFLSGAYGTVAFLKGETSAWVNLNVGWPWDFAPGWLFIRESSGWVSSPDGSELTFTRLEQMDVVYAVNEEMARTILPLTTEWSKRKDVVE